MPRGRRGQSRARASDARGFGARTRPPRAQQRASASRAPPTPTPTPTTLLRRSARISARSSRGEGNEPAAPSELLAPAHQSLSSRAAEAESSRRRRREQTRRERSEQEEEAEEQKEEEIPAAAPRAVTSENEPAPADADPGGKLLTNGTAGQELTLRIAVEPPTEALANTPLYPPVTVRLEGEPGNDAGELGGLWVFASLTNADGSSLLAPPRPDLLTGPLANSFHPIATPPGDATAAAQQQQQASFASFPGLAIRSAGRYSIRITLFRMAAGGAAPASVAGAAGLRQVQSRAVCISDSPGSVDADAAAERLLDSLRDQGMAIPLPPSASV